MEASTDKSKVMANNSTSNIKTSRTLNTEIFKVRRNFLQLFGCNIVQGWFMHCTRSNQAPLSENF
jgi:hypothetical protein